MRNSGFIYRILSLICLLLMCLSAYQLFGIWKEYHEGDDVYSDLLSQLTKADDQASSEPPASKQENPQSEDPTESAKSDEDNSQSYTPVDLNALAEINKDAYAWIAIPGTQVNYPILRSRDNEDYLRTTIDGKKLKAGSIFTDYRCKKPFEEANTIIYGHNLLNGAMFSSLINYKEESYLKAHPDIYIQTADGILIYEVYSCYITDENSETYSFHLETGSESYRKYLYMTQRSSLTLAFDEEITGPEQDEQIITLSTCTNHTDEERFVVHARFKERVKD